MNLSTAARNAAADAIADLVDGGAAAGHVEIREGTTVLATIAFNDPAYGAAASGVCDLDVTGGLSATADETGTADNWIVYDSNASEIFSGTMSEMTVTVDGTPSNAIVTGQTVEITAGSITMPAS